MNTSIAFSDLPPLPSYTLSPRPSLLPYVPDSALSLLLPIIVYWLYSGFFHFIDTRDWFPQYRLHTPAEVLKRNHVSRRDVVRDVVIQQIVQTAVGAFLTLFDDVDMVGMDDYNVAVWGRRLRFAQTAIPGFLAILGLDAQALARKASASTPVLAGLLAGGQYTVYGAGGKGSAGLSLQSWELVAAKLIYWVGVPALRFGLAILFVDTWQYFLHRAMHMNKWLYTTFHSRHHRLYVPYAYGALYNHPFEGFLLDTLGTGLAYLLTGLSPRQAICFFTGSTIKTVDDHCGYALPWDPLQHLTSNNAGYHDVHHQSWGIKTNFSQPFFTFWDRFLGTAWTGGDVSARYERARLAAERKTKQDDENKPSTDTVTNTGSQNATSRRSSSVSMGKAFAQAALSSEQVLQDAANGGAQIIAEEANEEADARAEVKSYMRSTPRKRTGQSSTSDPAGALKGLRNRVGSGTGSFHGGTGGLLGYDGTR